jgi:DNA (cytosine-5)-methyltransferase 1
VARLAAFSDSCIAGGTDAEVSLDVFVARLYGFNRDEFEVLLSCFPNIPQSEKQLRLDHKDWCKGTTISKAAVKLTEQSFMIPNHYAATLSKLDLQMVRAVPPGGNWKDIPESIPSQRLTQIRESYAAGEGSRSTYYGRLRPNAPAYTISTYFTRPGNGCHVHFDYDGGQHRTLSQREAARLQSFPDSFEFVGSRTAINQQIGNAVPPLLAYQIAKSFPQKGRFIDLFAGAGGLALGFIWAGWKPVIANELEPYFAATYIRNIHERMVVGDIREENVLGEIFEAARSLKRSAREPLLVLGGPPCQGFSTAGNRRSMSDDRNWLFKQYTRVLNEVSPDGFIFENVTGLLNMEGGKVFQMVLKELRGCAKDVSAWTLKAEQYGVPQRRTRVVIAGSSLKSGQLMQPQPITEFGQDYPSLFGTLPPAVTAIDALGDLPPLEPGEDGSNKEYVTDPLHPYQRLMRGLISAEDYVSGLNESPAAKPRRRSTGS